MSTVPETSKSYETIELRPDNQGRADDFLKAHQTGDLTYKRENGTVGIYKVTRDMPEGKGPLIILKQLFALFLNYVDKCLFILENRLNKPLEGRVTFISLEEANEMLGIDDLAKRTRSAASPTLSAKEIEMDDLSNKDEPAVPAAKRNPIREDEYEKPRAVAPRNDYEFNRELDRLENMFRGMAEALEELENPVMNNPVRNPRLQMHEAHAPRVDLRPRVPVQQMDIDQDEDNQIEGGGVGFAPRRNEPVQGPGQQLPEGEREEAPPHVDLAEERPLPVVQQMDPEEGAEDEQEGDVAPANVEIVREQAAPEKPRYCEYAEMMLGDDKLEIPPHFELFRKTEEVNEKNEKVEKGQNVHAGTFMLLALSQSSLADPTNRQPLSPEDKSKLASIAGIDERALDDIWTKAPARAQEKHCAKILELTAKEIQHRNIPADDIAAQSEVQLEILENNPEASPDALSNRVKEERFILLNESVKEEDSPKAAKFLNFLESQEAWKQKFPEANAVEGQ